MIATIDKELVDFVYDNYPAIHDKITRKQVENLLRIYDRQVIVVKEKEGIFHKQDKIKGVGFYFKLSDKSLKEVKSGLLDTGNPQNAIFCLKENGRNISFIFVVINGGMRIIFKG